MFVYYHVTTKREEVNRVLYVARKYTKNSIKYIKARNEEDAEFIFRIRYGMHLIFEHDVKVAEKCGIQVRIEKI